MKNLICVSLYDNLSIKVYNLSEVNNIGTAGSLFTEAGSVSCL